MHYRLPSLNALRAFEAAARNRSVAAAARELSVSSGAVSRQIRLLESNFQCDLLVRHRSGVVPTIKGNALLEVLTRTFADIAAVARQIAPPSASSGAQPQAQPIHLRFYSSFTVEWLAPRLPAFRASHPDVAIDLAVSVSEINWSDPFDLALTTKPPAGSEFHVEQLFDSLFALVCSPGFAAQPRANPLTNCTFLVAPRERALWSDVLKKLGGAPLSEQSTLEFESLSMTLQAARGGSGMALANLIPITGDLVQKTLVLPFPQIFKFTRPHVLVTPRARLRDPHIAAFRHWLFDEMAASEASLNGVAGDRPVINISS